MSSGRYIPAAVRRQLRQEANFGCARCGIPILQYHHIIPWEEEEHNRVEDMVALCGTCHQILGKLSRKVAYDLKKSPFNAKKGRLKGLLGTDRPKPSFVMGTNTFINTPVIFSFFGLPIFQYEIADGQSLISAYIPKSDFSPEVEIIRNDVVVDTTNFWDIEFKTNTLLIKRKQRDRYLMIDLRKEHALVAAKLEIGGHYFEFTDKKTNFAGSQYLNCTAIDCAGGFRFGNDDERLIPPNFAMRYPRAALIKRGTISKFFQTEAD